MTSAATPSEIPLTADAIAAGQAVYSPRLLAWYDLLVLSLSCRFAWRCPARQMLAMYNENVSDNHLEGGVGTGYFLDRCRFPTPQPRLALVDLNPHCLATTSRRLARFHPACYQRNLLEPLSLPVSHFDSAGINFVLHCLPRTLRDKGVIFDHLSQVVRPGGVIFGATILSVGVPVSFLAQRLMRHYNRRRIFSNESDSLEGLQEVLQARFDDWHIRTSGSVALFRARVRSAPVCRS
ncbi:MAG: class I SAM-dependent methyltransferase [Planctomycetales bacterium]